MDINVKATFKVLNKLESYKDSKGNDKYTIMVMQVEDCGKMNVNKQIYDAAEPGKEITMFGNYTSYDGRNYIAWKGVIGK